MSKAFVSHIAEESEFASVIKKWAEASFLRLFEVFVSSVPGDITAGNQWFQSLEQELNDSKVILVICSPLSVGRLWINFEAGAGWIKGIPVIPICHSGMTRGALPMPLVFFHAIEADDENFVSDLMFALATHFGHETPPISQEMVYEIRETLSQMQEQKNDSPEAESDGIIDVMASLEDDIAGLGEALSELGVFSNDLTAEMLAFQDEAESLPAGNSPGSTRNRQRMISQFGTKISQYAGRLTRLNDQYGETIPKVEQGMERFLGYSSDSDGIEIETLDGMYATLDETQESIDGLKNAVVNARDSMKQIPNVQRDLTRGLSNLTKQLGILIGHLDSTLEMFRRGKAKLEVLRLRN